IKLCHVYNIDEEKFIELWVAYTVPQSLNINPTIDNLIKFEKEDLEKINKCSLEFSTQTNIHFDTQSNEEITYPFKCIKHPLILLISLSSCNFYILSLHILVACNTSNNVLDIYSNGECATLKLFKL
ncbi:hypothetical protein E2986_11207, partial [Frieseomelitta varia]